MFTPHLHKLDLIEKNLNQGKYADAEKNIRSHLKAELQGNALLVNLKASIQEYEKLLRSAYADLEDLKDPNVPNKLMLRKRSVGEIKLARQQLHDLHRQIETLANTYFRR